MRHFQLKENKYLKKIPSPDLFYSNQVSNLREAARNVLFDSLSS